MESDTKNYEIAYLLSPSVQEEEVLMHVGKLTSIIEEAKGTVKHVQEPKKRKLAYPVNKELTAFLGWTRFAMPKEEVAQLEKKVVLQPMILRHLIVEEQINKRPSRFRTGAPRVAAQGSKEERPTEKLDLEALDKKLEEILGK